MLASTFVLLCTIFASEVYGVASTVDQYLNPEWIEPHAWAAERDPLRQMCPQVPVVNACDSECDNRDVEIAFRKLVHNFFDRNKFRRDDSSNYMHRTVHIHATEEQLEKLYKLTKSDDIDGLLGEILVQSNFGMTQLIKEYTMEVTSNVWDNLSFRFDVPPRTKEITINFALLVLAYFVCRRFGINFVVVIVFGVVYFLYEYLDHECHKRIAVEDTVSFIYGRNKNPCEESTNRGWFSFFLGKNNRAECRDYMLNQRRDGKQCGMVDLFHEFTGNILFKQMSMFFMKLADLIQSISTTYGTIVTVITLYFMKDILKVMIYSIFKFILNPTSWSGFAAAAQNVQNEVPQCSSQSQIASEVDIKDVNLGKALDLANNKMQLMLTENAISAALEAHLPPTDVQNASPIDDQMNVKRQISEFEASDVSSSSNTSISMYQLHLEPSGIQRLPDTNQTTSSDSSGGPTSESESYEKITYDELIAATAVDVAASPEGQATLSDELAMLDDNKSSKSSICSTLPSDIELLNGDTDSFSDKIESKI